MKIEPRDIVEPLKKLLDAQELLDRVLLYYDVYSGQFRELPKYECGYNSGYSLNDQVRAYINFDDSE